LTEFREIMSRDNLSWNEYVKTRKKFNKALQLERLRRRVCSKFTHASQQEQKTKTNDEFINYNIIWTVKTPSHKNSFENARNGEVQNTMDQSTSTLFDYIHKQKND